jgi:hypothetical protein
MSSSAPPVTQLNQDLRLLDLLEALPRPTEGNTAALRERLTALCAAQSIEATPTRIEQVVTHYLEGRLVVAAAPELPWSRPASREEWQTVQASLQEAVRADVANDRCRGIVGVSVGVLSILVGIGLGIWLNDNWADRLFFGFLGTLLGLASGVILGFLSAGLTGALQATRTVTQQRKGWVAQWCAVNHAWAGQWDETTPDLKRLQRWLSAPSATEALRHIACSPVPLSHRDAHGLDALAEADEAQLRQQNEVKDAEVAAQEWQRSLTMLASTAKPSVVA